MRPVAFVKRHAHTSKTKQVHEQRKKTIGGQNIAELKNWEQDNSVWALFTFCWRSTALSEFNTCTTTSTDLQFLDGAFIVDFTIQLLNCFY